MYICICSRWRKFAAVTAVVAAGDAAAARGCWLHTAHERDLYQIMILTGTTRAASSNSSIRRSRSMACILVRCRWGLRGAAVHNTRKRARTLHREFEYSS